MSIGNPATVCRLIPLSLALGLLCACGNEQEPQAASAQAGDSGSSVTLYSGTPDSEEPTIRVLEIDSIVCDTERERRRTRVDFSEGGRFTVEAGRMGDHEAWLLQVSLPELEFPRRDSILVEQADERFLFDDNGSVQGIYPFGVFGENPMRYALELDIRC